MILLGQLTPSLVELVILFLELDLRLIRIGEYGQSGLKLSIELLLSGLKDCDAGLELDLLILGTSSWLTWEVRLVFAHSHALLILVLLTMQLCLIALLFLLNEDVSVGIAGLAEVCYELGPSDATREIKVNR